MKPWQLLQELQRKRKESGGARRASSFFLWLRSVELEELFLGLRVGGELVVAAGHLLDFSFGGHAGENRT